MLHIYIYIYIYDISRLRVKLGFKKNKWIRFDLFFSGGDYRLFSHEKSNETLCSIKGGVFLKQLTDYWLLKDSAR